MHKCGCITPFSAVMVSVNNEKHVHRGFLAPLAHLCSTSLNIPSNSHNKIYQKVFWLGHKCILGQVISNKKYIPYMVNVKFSYSHNRPRALGETLWNTLLIRVDHYYKQDSGVGHWHLWKMYR